MDLDRLLQLSAAFRQTMTCRRPFIDGTGSRGLDFAGVAPARRCILGGGICVISMMTRRRRGRATGGCSMGKHLTAVALAGTAALTLFAGGSAQAQPNPPVQCFYSTDWSGW